MPGRVGEGALGPVTADMLISDVLSTCPGAALVFERHGLGCAACLAAGMETLSAVASVHDVATEELIDDLNRLWEEGSCVPGKEPLT